MSAVAAFNFRSTLGYVTDGAGQTYVNGTDLYATVRDGHTFGWVGASAGSVDRSTGVDVRLAGLNYESGADRDFQFDLPSAGTYLIGLAMGDATTPLANQKVEIYDNTTLKLTIGTHSVSAGEFWDASDVKYSNANWPGSQTPVSIVFATSTLMMRIKAVSGTTAVAHLSIATSGGGGGSIVIPVFQQGYRRRRS